MKRGILVVGADVVGARRRFAAACVVVVDVASRTDRVWL
jgi:hypothetical protein